MGRTVTVPSSAALATLDPETAANSPLKPIVECSRPPGSPDSSFSKDEKARSPKFER